MNVRVLLFASAADAAGRSEVNLDLPDGARVSDVLAELSRLVHGRALASRPMVAVNARYAAPDTVLAAGDEVAVIPPVAGG
jgi:molybdopterin converting factor subunit 1